MPRRARPVGGTILANTGPLPFTAATFQGTLTSEVIANDPANPFGPGNLTFTYLLSDTNGGSIHRLTVPGYGLPGILTDASYQAPAAPGSIIPTSFDRSSDPFGDVIGALFTSTPLGLGDIPAGSSGALIVIQTNSQVFDSSIASTIDGSTAQVATFSPTRTYLSLRRSCCSASVRLACWCDGSLYKPNPSLHGLPARFSILVHQGPQEGWMTAAGIFMCFVGPWAG